MHRLLESSNLHHIRYTYTLVVPWPTLSETGLECDNSAPCRLADSISHPSLGSHPHLLCRQLQSRNLKSPGQCRRIDTLVQTRPYCWSVFRSI